MAEYAEKIKELQRDYEELISSDQLNWKDVRLLGNLVGVYAIFLNGKCIYVGHTNKFHVRMNDLLDKSTHTLHRKLLKEHSLKQVQDIIKSKCKYRVKKYLGNNEATNLAQAECLEHFAIEILEPPYNYPFYKKENK